MITLELALFNILSDNIVVEVIWDCGVERLGVSDECSHDISINGLMIDIFPSWSNSILMDRGNMVRQLFILGLISLIQEQENEVETGE